VYRFRYVFCLILVILLVPMGCWLSRNSSSGERAAKIRASAPSAGESLGKTADEEAGLYTLRIVFDGLVTLAVKDQSEHPQEVWALLGNLSDPTKLSFGKDLPPHQSHLSFTPIPGQGIRVWGRSTGNGVDLNNEDLSLVANVVEPSNMEMVLNTTTKDVPCTVKDDADCAREQQDFKWTVDLDLAASSLAAEKPADKTFKECLTHERFDCTDPFPVLAARLRLNKGRIFVKDLQLDRDNQSLLTYKFDPPITGFNTRAMARRIAVEFKVKDPVELRSKPLTGGGRPAESIFLRADPGKVVEVVLANHRNCPDDDCSKYGEKDFLFNFNLLNQPDLFAEAALPTPTKFRGPSAFNGQCSPGTYKAP
jgi:hypothetical protein